MNKASLVGPPLVGPPRKASPISADPTAGPGPIAAETRKQEQGFKDLERKRKPLGFPTDWLLFLSLDKDGSLLRCLPFFDSFFKNEDQVFLAYLRFYDNYDIGNLQKEGR